MKGGAEMDRKMQLFEALGGVGEEYVSECINDKKHLERRKTFFAAAAAIVAVFFLAAAPVLFGRTESESVAAENNHYEDNEKMKTSEKYDDLEQLLKYLSRHETHSGNDKIASEGRNMTVSAENTECSGAVTDGSFSYHCGESGIIITRLGGEETEKLAVINEPASRLLLSGSVLAAFSDICEETDDPIDLDYSVICRIYDVSTPEKPEKKLEFIQSGDFSDAVLTGESSMMLFTSDGQCACGYSSPTEVKNYVPEVICGEESITLPEENTYILGEPTRISYIASSEVDLNGNEVKSLSAVYGDIDKMFVSGGSTSFVVKEEIYNFSLGGGLHFDGKTVLSKILGMKPKSESAEVTEVKRFGDKFRIIGTVNRETGLSIYALETDAQGESSGFCVSGNTGKVLTIDEIIPAGNRSVIVYSWFDMQKTESFASVMYADFAGGVKLTETSLLISRVDGIDMLYAFGNPYGRLFPTTDLGGGIYARFNPTPDGIDLFRFSGDSAECIYDSPRLTESENDRFMLEGFSLGGGKFAAIMVEPQSSELREVDYRFLRSWLCVYSVDTAKSEPFKLISKTEIPQSENVYVFNAGERWYFVCAGCDDKASVCTG